MANEAAKKRSSNFNIVEIEMLKHFGKNINISLNARNLIPIPIRKYIHKINDR